MMPSARPAGSDWYREKGLPEMSTGLPHRRVRGRRTLGLVVFSLIHGGAFSVSVPAGPALLGIGGSFWLGLPPTSFALLPFVALLVLGRFVARRTESTVLFACSTAITYALVVSLLAALG